MSDEQRMREQFEKWAVPRELPLSMSRFDYADNETFAAWVAWQAAWQARDAEVQRLERVLSRVQRIVRNWQHDTHQSDYDALDELSTVLQAAAIARAEGGAE